ncbi:MAG: AAA family ATPase, partial [Candidatus Riflebacteria bacterium]|nr:AAA family ATPase [Candidatus Riflebacteria bacterium]
IMDKIYLSDAVADYIARLVDATSPFSETAMTKVKDYVQYGACPRAAIAVAESARGVALLAGRPTVGFKDVKEVFVPALNHRVLLNYKARFEGITARNLLEEILEKVSVADLDISDDISLKEK